jgi:hypothetical protein
MSSSEVVVVAAFRCVDLVRLHALLVAYESPLTTPGEEHLRCEDVRAHRELCEQIGRLLADATLVADGGKL